MFIIIGAVIVVGSILTGFVLEGGHILALYQPLELLIIGGAAVGALLIGNTMNVLKGIMSQIAAVFGSGYSKQDYQDLLVMMFEIFNIARKDGLIGLEAHVENPDESEIFQRYPKFLNNHHAIDFFADTMRVIISGAVQPHDLDDLMENDIDALREEELHPSHALNTTSDSLPGLGIVAAVLGIVITMGAIDGPPEEIGHKVGAALVGTFLGILGCYGFVGPIAANMKFRVNEDMQYITCMKHALLSFNKGVAGVIAVEFARRTLFIDVRPGFTELEEACNASKRR